MGGTPGGVPGRPMLECVDELTMYHMVSMPFTSGDSTIRPQQAAVGPTPGMMSEDNLLQQDSLFYLF